MSTLIRGQLVTLFALLTAMVVTLAACGGGSSSSGSGSSGGVVSGTVDNGFAAVQPGAEQQPLLFAVTDMLIEPAGAAGVSGVTVELLDGGGGVVASRTTNANGRFMFSGLAPGNYSIRLTQNGSVLGQTPSIQVDQNTRTELQVSLEGGITSVNVESQGDQVAGQVTDDSSSDDGNSMDDDNSVDDNSDDNSADDDSADGNSTDGDSDDDNSDG